ncbi:MAG: PqqD family protein [Armatimonadota bacterium]
MAQTSALVRVLEKLRLKKRGPQLTREQAMAALPLRNPTLKWRRNDRQDVVVTLTRRKDTRGRLISFFFHVPSSRDITLDEVGSKVWSLSNGKRTVDEMIDALASEYKLNRREAEVSLTEYLRQLGQRGMVGLLVDRDEGDEAEEAQEEESDESASEADDS